MRLSIEDIKSTQSELMLKVDSLLGTGTATVELPRDVVFPLTSVRALQHLDSKLRGDSELKHLVVNSIMLFSLWYVVFVIFLITRFPQVLENAFFLSLFD